MKTHDSGMTLIEVLIVGAIIAIIVTVVVGFFRRGTVGDVEATAQEFAGKMGEPYTGVSCVKSDSDGDGYVSCTIFRKDKDPLAIECARAISWNDGCRLQRPAVRAR